MFVLFVLMASDYHCLVFSNLYSYMYKVAFVQIGISKVSANERITTFSDLSWEEGLGYDLVTHPASFMNISDKRETGYLCSSRYTWGG